MALLQFPCSFASLAAFKDTRSYHEPIFANWRFYQTQWYTGWQHLIAIACVFNWTRLPSFLQPKCRIDLKRTSNAARRHRQAHWFSDCGGWWWYFIKRGTTAGSVSSADCWHQFGACGLFGGRSTNWNDRTINSHFTRAIPRWASHGLASGCDSRWWSDWRCTCFKWSGHACSQWNPHDWIWYVDWW